MGYAVTVDHCCGMDTKAPEERYRALLKNIETAQVFEKSEVKVWECRNCGHVVVGTKAPEICPVCNHPQSYFEIREENEICPVCNHIPQLFRLYKAEGDYYKEESDY